MEADTSYIARIERGQRQPSLDVLSRIAEALGVPPGHFFVGWESELERATNTETNQPARRLLNELKPLSAKV